MLQTIIRSVFGTLADRVQSIGATMSQAARVEVQGKTYFVKWRPDAPAQFFTVEARGLDLLRNAEAIRVPEVIDSAEAGGSVPAYLILEWIERAPGRASRAFAERFGQALAQLHGARADRFGLEYDNYIGELPQYNTCADSWPVFYRDQRLLPQIERARQNGHLPAYRETLLNRLLARLEDRDLLGAVQSVPSLLHGDLWSGNFMVAPDDQPALIDPAVYYGDREVEMAFTELFGGFPPGFYSAYREAYPLDAGYERRRSLYQLYPLLVHLNHFGESYGGHVDAVCRQYV